MAFADAIVAATDRAIRPNRRRDRTFHPPTTRFSAHRVSPCLRRHFRRVWCVYTRWHTGHRHPRGHRRDTSCQADMGIRETLTLPHPDTGRRAYSACAEVYPSTKARKNAAPKTQERVCSPVPCIESVEDPMTTSSSVAIANRRQSPTAGLARSRSTSSATTCSASPSCTRAISAPAAASLPDGWVRARNIA